MKNTIINIFGKKLKALDINANNKTNIDLRDLTVQNIKYILSKAPNERTNEDIAYLKNFILSKTKFADKLIKEHIEEYSQNIITILSTQNAFYKKIESKEEVIYDMNDELKYFYIILNGKVSIYEPEKIDCEIDIEEYYKMIIDYRNNKEKYLLEKTLRENRVILPIDINDVNKLEKILLKIHLLTNINIKLHKKDPHFLDNILTKFGFKYSDFAIQSYEEYLEEKNKKIKEEKTGEDLLKYNLYEALKMCKENEDKILEQLNSEITDDLCKKYLFLIRKHELPVSYYRYKETKILNTFDYFGESHNGISKEKIETKSKYLELLCFPNDIYNEYDLNMKSKYAGTQDQFLLNNFFMDSITKSTFEKNYLQFFEYMKFYCNQIIIKENALIEYIYFVKSGNIKIYSTRSIVQNHLLIQIIINIMKQRCPNITDNKSKFKAYSDIKVDFNKIQSELNLNKNIHIMNFIERQCIGFECFYFGFNSLYTAMAFSDKVEVYRITIDNLFKILSYKNKKALYEFALQAEKTLKIFLDRLIEVNNMLIVNYSKKNENRLKDASDFMEREIIMNQIKREELKGAMNIKNSRIKQQKMLKQNNSCFINNVLSCPKRRNTRLSLKNNFKFNKNKLLENIGKVKHENKKFNLGLNFKLFDYKENLKKQKNRELLRESIELGRLSMEEDKRINRLKLQNKRSKDFIRLSKGEKRIFISSSTTNLDLSTIRKNYCFKKRNIFFVKKNKMKTTKPINKENKKREFFPKLNTAEERMSNFSSKIDRVINDKWIEFDVGKYFENSSSYSDKEISSREKGNVSKKGNEGNNNIYKKFAIKNI